jgi:ketosteroid isomerase-like protein
MSEQADKTAIRALIEGIDQAHRNRDAAAIVAPYSADALLFDLAPPLAHNIKVADVAAWLDTWEGPVTRETRDLEITIDGILAFAHCYVRTAATTKEGCHHAQ